MKFTKLHKEAIVRAILQDMPPVDRVKWANDIKAEIVKKMSPAVRKIYNVNPLALRVASVPFSSEHRYWGADIVVGDVTKEQIAEIVAPYERITKERDDMKKKLEFAFAGINTLKQALTAFPEFKKYYPTEMEPTKNLPALANVVADLSKLGWPKGVVSTKEKSNV
jgi:phosphoglycolate phosphatase-like HAD superfamily hydrolase